MQDDRTLRAEPWERVFERAVALSDELFAQLRAHDTSVPDTFLESALGAFAIRSNVQSYRVLPVELLTLLSPLTTSAELLDLALRTTGAATIAAFDFEMLPLALQATTLTELTRMLDEWSSTERRELLRLDADRTLQDLGVCSARLLAAGAQLAQPAVHIPQSLPLRLSATDAVSLGRILIASEGGAGFLELHTSERTLSDFTPRGWVDCYMRLARVLESDDDASGVMGSSWFFDPALAQVSPRLSYLHDLPRMGGADFFSLGADTESVRYATATSPTRRRLHAAGKYEPARYLMVWKRDALLRWAHEHARSGATH